MKLCCVDHYRCDDLDASTYIWCEDDWTEEQFEEAVERAADAYNASLKAYTEAGDKDPYPQGSYVDPRFRDYPNMTVAEVIKIHEEKKAEREEWKRKQNRAHRSFSSFLEDEGLINFYGVDAEYETNIWWGHRHGERLDYESTDISKKDLREEIKLTSKVRYVRKA